MQSVRARLTHQLQTLPPLHSTRASPRVGAYFFFKDSILISLRCFFCGCDISEFTAKNFFSVSNTNLQFPGPPTPSLPPSASSPSPAAHLAATDPLPGHSSRPSSPPTVVNRYFILLGCETPLCHRRGYAIKMYC